MDSLTAHLRVDFDPLRLVASVAALAILYPLGLSVYRLTLDPLAKFPGPRIAAATSWYEFYYDWWCEGQYIFEIEKMHKRYGPSPLGANAVDGGAENLVLTQTQTGPIVRVNPAELSIRDPAAYNDIYVTERKRRTENYNDFCKGIDFDGSHMFTVDHDLHRKRRKPLEPFFSRLGVSHLEPMVIQLVEKLVARLEALKGSNTVIRLDHAFSALSGDVMGRVCFEDKKDFLDDPKFAVWWIASMIPENIILWAFPRGQSFNNLKQIALKHIVEAKHEKLESDKRDTHRGIGTSIFRYIVNSDMPESERSDERLAKEAQLLLGGGTVSTARTMVFVSYFILANPSIRSRLGKELEQPMSRYPKVVPTWAELEKVPILQALVKEGLRLSYGTMHRLPRCSPDVPIQYRQWTIPVGVPVGMSSYFMHTDPSVYEKPFEFIPERWLGDMDPAMNRNYVPFSRGSRNCIGMNLAYLEIYLTLAILFHGNGPKLELFETDESDVLHIHDYHLPLPKLSTKGVRVLIR